jgi:3',5'-cyclic AMP phosphodiesterase CpdA
MSNTAEKTTNHEELRVYWLTDLHLKDEVTGLPEAEGAVKRDRFFYASKDKLRQAADIIIREKPDYVVCTGDITDSMQPFASFREEWGKITVPKDITLGNHDLPNGYASIVEQLGYEERPIVAGSKFNRAFSLQKGGVQARIIMLDTNIGEDGVHRANVEGVIQEDAFRWLEEEMNCCAEELILVFSHNGIGGPEKYFDQQHVERFKEIAENAASARPGLHIVNLAGHHHVYPTAVVKELAPQLTFINGVAMICQQSSFINVVKVKADGTITLDYREVGYPYQGGAN